MEYRNEKGLTENEFLTQYDPARYPSPAVTVDMLLFAKEGADLYVLLIERKDHPFIHSFALPGGFVDMDEALIDAAYRELKEETNLEDVPLRQLYTWGRVDRDPRTRVITVAYMGVVDKQRLKPAAGDDAADVGWFKVMKEKVSEEGEITKSILTFVRENETKQIQYQVTEPDIEQIYYNENNVYLESVGDGYLAADHAEIINYGVEQLAHE